MVSIRKEAKFFIVCCLSAAVFFAAGASLRSPSSAADLPVKDPSTEGYKETPYYGVRNLFSVEQLYSAFKEGSKDGFVFDLTGSGKLLDGTEIDVQKVYGTLYAGPYPFESREARFAYKRFGSVSEIRKGKGTVKIASLLEPSNNTEHWTNRCHISVRIELYLETAGRDRKLGIYEVFVTFTMQGGYFSKLPSLTEGPFINLVRSEDSSEVLVSFKTDQETLGKVVLEGGKSFQDRMPTKRHEIKVSGLLPSRKYRYRVQIEGAETKSYELMTAPRPGQGRVTFAYLADSRSGVGGGREDVMGVNSLTAERLINFAYRAGANFALVGGDLVNGYTTVKEDFTTQLYAWKQITAGFWHERPIYTGMGNHESLLRVYDDGSRYGISLDRWPYGTDSAEAVFAEEFVNPENGPLPADPGRPAYKKNVYSFQYGPVKIISFNNSYWVSYRAQKFGGSPEGCIMDDQIDWIAAELESAEKDPSVHYVILFGHKPLFPNSGHVENALWYGGDNRIRAYTWDAHTGAMRPEKKGIIEVRNEIVRLVGRFRKVAAVLGSDEHAYHKTLISKNIPLGDPAKDYENESARICAQGKKCSSLEDITYPIWFLTSGGAGAPYSSEAKTPWNGYWKENPGACPYEAESPSCYLYSAQENILIFKADQHRLSLKVYNLYGELVDSIRDLMAVKKE